MRAAVLAQLLLPVFEPQGGCQPAGRFAWVRGRLLDAFGGLTCYTRAPAEGLWEGPSGHLVRDQVVVYEVLCDEADASWWGAFKRELEERFLQQQVVITLTRLQVV